MSQEHAFTIPTIDIDKNLAVPGDWTYAAIPRVGDYITVGPPEGHDIYQVVAVNFADNANMGATADMFVRRLGPGPVQKYIPGAVL